MSNGQRIRIRLKAFDHRMLDQSAMEIRILPNERAHASPGRFHCRL